jgi:hypothetical protein
MGVIQARLGRCATAEASRPGCSPAGDVGTRQPATRSRVVDGEVWALTADGRLQCVRRGEGRTPSNGPRDARFLPSAQLCGRRAGARRRRPGLAGGGRAATRGQIGSRFGRACAKRYDRYGDGDGDYVYDDGGRSANRVAQLEGRVGDVSPQRYFTVSRARDRLVLHFLPARAQPVPPHRASPFRRLRAGGCPGSRDRVEPSGCGELAAGWVCSTSRPVKTSESPIRTRPWFRLPRVPRTGVIVTGRPGAILAQDSAWTNSARDARRAATEVRRAWTD